MREILLSFLLFGVLIEPGWAAPFIAPGQVSSSERPASFDRVLNASVRFWADGSCTGTWTSPQGYLLTAFHCLQDCIPESLLVSTPLKARGSRPYAGIQIASDLSGVVCRIGNPDSGEVQESGFQAQIVHVGAKGWLDADTAKKIRREDFDAYLAAFLGDFSGRGGVGDFAIVQVVQDRPEEKLPRYFHFPPVCLSTGNQNPKVGESVWSISYPNYQRGSGSSQKEPRFSRGVRTPGVASIAEMPREIVSQFEEEYSRRESFLSTLDVAHGASGSAVLNEAGEIVGISVVTLNPTDEYISGAAVSIGIEAIRKSVVDGLGAERAKEIFSCL